MPFELRVLSPSILEDLDFMPAIARIHLRAWLTNAAYKAIYYGPPSSYPAIVRLQIMICPQA